MKNFTDFLNEEITIKGNEAIPGENDKSEPSYISGVDAKGAEKIRGVRDPRPLFAEIMRLLTQSKSISKGKEENLEKLAEKLIRSVYPGILDNVDLDIKLVTGDEIAEFIQDENEEEEEDNEEPEKLTKSSNKELKKEVHKRKIANSVIQGEAKNTKFIIEMPECLDELKSIFGDAKGTELKRVLLEISKIADKLDWIIPIEAKADMMEMAPQGAGGAVSVKWPEAKKEKKEKSAEDILADIEKGGSLDDNKEEIEELLSTGNPVIKARGVDFTMLLHETVKGIYELIAAAGIPADETMAKNVMFNTSSYADEAEDFKYGPYIAGDLRDFVNKSPNIDKYPNIREFVFGKLITMPAEEFLMNIKNILMNTPEARTLVNNLVSSIIDELDEYEKSSSEFDMKKTLGEFGNNDSDEDNEDTLSNSEKDNDEISKISNRKVDYSDMSQRDIQELVDDALDAGDYEKVKMLSDYLKEGKEIYLKELERINESHAHHTRRRDK